MMGLSANVALLFAIKKLKLHISISYRFIIALVISDLCLSAIALPLQSLQYSGVFANTDYAEIMEIASTFISYILSQFSGLMIFTVSMDRYFHMKYLHLYNTEMTRRKGNVLIFFNLVFSLLLGVVLALASLYNFLPHFFLFSLIMSLIVFILGMLNYVKAYISLRKRVSPIAITSNTSNNIRRADVQFTKSVLFIMSSLVFRYVPYFTFGIFVSQIMEKKDNELYTDIAACYLWSVQFVYMGAFINAILFCAFNKKLKDYLVSKFLCRGSVEE